MTCTPHSVPCLVMSPLFLQRTSLITSCLLLKQHNVPIVPCLLLNRRPGRQSHIPAFILALFKEAADINCCLSLAADLWETPVCMYSREVRGLGLWVGAIGSKVGHLFSLGKSMNILKSLNISKYRLSSKGRLQVWTTCDLKKNKK